MDYEVNPLQYSFEYDFNTSTIVIEELESYFLLAPQILNLLFKNSSLLIDIDQEEE